MKKSFFRVVSGISGKNLQSTPKEVIADQMLEPRALPMGRKEFENWSNRIISGAVIPGGKEDIAAFIATQKSALANMIMHLGPTESHKPDAFFIHSLRKAAVNEVAHSIIMEYQAQKKAKIEAEEKAKKASDEAKQG